MKKIYFIRHAKAEKNSAIDFDRDLTKKGKTTAQNMAKQLKNSDVVVDQIFTSSAKRSLKTAEIFAKELKIKKFKRSKKLYNSNIDYMIKFIEELDDKLENIAIVGHNPELAQICEFLSDSYIQKLPTSSVFCIEFNIDKFSDIKTNHGNAILFNYPKKI